jgi:hypothetical protein
VVQRVGRDPVPVRIGSLSTLGFSPGLPAFLVLGVSIVLAPVAVYVVLSEE